MLKQAHFQHALVDVISKIKDYSDFNRIINI